MARNTIQKFDQRAQIAGTPEFVVGGGEMASVLTALGGNVAGRLKQMADRAAATEGEMAGMNAGQVAGVGYLQRQSSVAAAAPEGELDLRPFLTSPDRQSHLDGVQPQFRGALARLFAAAPPEIQAQLKLGSGYRSEERQAQLYQAALVKYGSEAEARKWVAPPGKSRHQHGDAYDLEYGNDAARSWVHENAGKFGLAFPMGHEPWHIELAGARGAVEPPATGGLNPQPLALRNDNTIFGDNFDGAAIRTYGWRMQEGVSNAVTAAYDQFKDDPTGFANALTGIRDQFSRDDNFGDPRVRDLFDKTFSERTETYTRAVAQRHEARVMEEQAASFGAGVDAMRGDLEKQAYLLGANPEADRILASQSAVVLRNIEAAEAANVITPSAAAAEREKVNTTLAYARTNGVFASLPSPAAKQAFANGLLTDWANNEGPLTGLGYTQVKALADQLSAQALQAQNQLTGETKAERARVEGLIAADVASIATTGVALDTAANDLDPERLAVLGIDTDAWQAQRDFARKGWEATAGMELETSAELNDRLAALQPRPGAPDFVQQSEIYSQAVARAQAVLKERETDPLGQAARAGMVDLQPINPSSPDSLALRRQQAEAVASSYGTPVTYFRAEERSAITTALYAQPELMPGFARNISETFGDKASAALSEISEAGPELAYAAGITNALGDNGIISEVSRVIAARQAKAINVKMPSDAVMTAAAGNVIGSSLAGNPATRSAALNVAQILFEGQAAALGFDPADVKDQTSPAFAAWERAVNRALGARIVNGVQYGGIARVNNGDVVAPSSMPADRLQQIITAITDADLSALPPIAAGNGLPVAAWQLHGAQLMSVGDGQYRVALGDPNGLDPQFVTSPDGSYWMLDAAELERIQSTRPQPTTAWDAIWNPVGTALRMGQ